MTSNDRNSLMKKLQKLDLTTGEKIVTDQLTEDLLGYPVAADGTLTFDFDLDDCHEFEAETSNRNPKLSKFDWDQMERIVELHFEKKWVFSTLQQHFRQLHSPNELYRFV